MIATRLQLQENESAALDELVRRLLTETARPVVALWLFGSKARGDARPESDVDVLIVSQDASAATRDAIHLIAARLSLEHNVLLNTHIVSRSRWEEMAVRQATLWRHVQQEGIPLTSAP